jgi:antitoxin HigA-1
MTDEIEILKGIHPGIILERKIREKGFKKGQLALECREYPQTLTAITKGRRDMNISLALKMEKALNLDEGYFMILQVYYDIKKQKSKQSKNQLDLSKLREVLFWDTRMESIDWQKQYKSVIRRVFERGNEREKTEIKRFYGSDKINEVLKELPSLNQEKL